MVRVGASTEVELKERKHRLEDAVSATRAAIEEGIVAGGGAALVHASTVLDKDLGLSGRRGHGASPSCAARWSEPLTWIARNAGMEGAVAVSKVRDMEVGHRPERRRPASTGT